MGRIPSQCGNLPLTEHRKALEDGLTIISGEQVAPLQIAMGVRDGIQHIAQGPLGVGVLTAAEDIARPVVVPGPGFPRSLVILLGQQLNSIFLLTMESKDFLIQRIGLEERKH